MATVNDNGAVTNLVWFVPEPYRSQLQPGDIVSIIGFRQFRIERDGKEFATGTIVEPRITVDHVSDSDG